MKKLLNLMLVKYLGKQIYPYLWEIKLLSMIKKEDSDEFNKFCRKALNFPKAAICMPQHPFKKSDEEIIDYIKKIRQNENRVCMVVAHANYNPIDLQALYVLDCEEGREAECFHSVFELWRQCSELYFLEMDVHCVIRKIIDSHPKPNKWKFINRIIHMFTGHDEDLIFLSNIHGDMIMSSGGKRSFWECPSCGGTVLKDELYEN